MEAPLNSDPIEWDFFLWLVLTRLGTHVLLLAWLLKACWASSCGQTRFQAPHKTIRTEAGARWVEGALRHLSTLSSLMLAGDPGRSSFGEPNQAPEAGVNFQIASGNLTSERTISLKERGGGAHALKEQETEELNGQSWRDSMQSGCEA